MSHRAYPWPPVHPTADAFAAQIPFICMRIARAGIPTQDAEDILQEVLTGAIMTARGDRYRPDPRIDPKAMLRRWLASIVFNQIEHYRKRAYRRREEIAVHLTIPTGTAATRLRAARKRVKRVKRAGDR